MFKLKSRSFFICFLFLFVLLACRNLKNSPEVRRIDSLKSVLSTVNSKLAEIDSLKIYTMYKDNQNNTMQLGMYFNNKKENGVWECITQYDRVNFIFSDFINNRSLFISQIQKSKKQLDDLRSDFINKSISIKQFNTFFNQESDIINKLNTDVVYSVDQTKNGMALFDTLNPKVLSIIAKLKEEKNNSTKNK
jgi:hypothetical protein